MSAKTTPVFHGVGNLLNIWVGTSKPSRWCADLTEVSMQAFRYRIDQFDHVLTVARQRLLHRAVFKEGFNDRILRGQRLQLPITCRVGNGNTESGKRLIHLLMRIEIDVVTLWTTKQRPLRRLLRQNIL